MSHLFLNVTTIFVTSLKGQCIVYDAVYVFKAHMILLDSKKIMQFIVDVTNTRDKELLADITKVSITGYMH